MSGITSNITKAKLERLLAARRQIRAEFDEVLSLSDDDVLAKLTYYRSKSSSNTTKTLLDDCISALSPLAPESDAGKELTRFLVRRRV